MDKLTFEDLYRGSEAVAGGQAGSFNPAALVGKRLGDITVDELNQAVNACPAVAAARPDFNIPEINVNYRDEEEI